MGTEMTKHAKRPIGRIVRSALATQRMTQRSLASLVGCSYFHINKICRDRYDASGELKWKIAKALKIDPDLLMSA